MRIDHKCHASSVRCDEQQIVKIGSTESRATVHNIHPVDGYSTLFGFVKEASGRRAEVRLLAGNEKWEEYNGMGLDREHWIGMEVIKIGNYAVEWTGSELQVTAIHGMVKITLNADETYELLALLYEQQHSILAAARNLTGFHKAQDDKLHRLLFPDQDK
jgi:hypothetical protein